MAQDREIEADQDQKEEIEIQKGEKKDPLDLVAIALEEQNVRSREISRLVSIEIKKENQDLKRDKGFL